MVLTTGITVALGEDIWGGYKCNHRKEMRGIRGSGDAAAENAIRKKLPQINRQQGWMVFATVARPKTPDRNRQNAPPAQTQLPGGRGRRPAPCHSGLGGPLKAALQEVLSEALVVERQLRGAGVGLGGGEPAAEQPAQVLGGHVGEQSLELGPGCGLGVNRPVQIYVRPRENAFVMKKMSFCCDVTRSQVSGDKSGRYFLWRTVSQGRPGGFWSRISQQQEIRR